MNYLDIKKLLNNEIDVTNLEIIYTLMHDIAKMSVNHENVQNLLLDTTEEFDVAIVEWLYSELYAG